MPNNDATLAYLQHLAQEDASEQLWVRTLREYAAGEHPTYLTTRQKQFVGLKAKDASHLYAHNLCQLVIDAAVDRLRVIGFSGVDDTSVEAAMAWCDANRFDALQVRTHEAACRDEESYIAVDWDATNDRPVWFLNTRFDGTQGVKLHRDPTTDEPLYASKRWQEVDTNAGTETGATRLTLYFPDRIERWISAKAGEGVRIKTGNVESELLWKPYREGAEPWPLPWVDKAGAPLGPAVIAFLNPGGSEIAQVIPLQDMLNKSDIDLIAGADLAGFAIMWVAGVPKMIDTATGEEISLTIGPGHLVRFDNPSATLNRIPPADITQLIAACYYWIESVAGVTRTPQHLLRAPGSDAPSGESLYMRELGLVSKVRRKQVVFGNAWEDVLSLSFKLAELHGAAFPSKQLNAQWENAEVRDPAGELNAAEAKKRIGVPDEQIFAELGYTPEQIAAFKEMLQEQATRQQNIGAALLTAFEKGQGNAVAD